MNTGGVIKGGLLAGLVINVGEGVLNAVILAQPWEELAAEMGMGNDGAVMAFYLVAAFLIGILGVWMYAAMRPRLGPGPMTAAKVGLAIWFLGWFMPTVPFTMGGVFPPGMMTIALVWGVVELPLAVMAGAWLYKEDGGAAQASTMEAPAS